MGDWKIVILLLLLLASWAKAQVDTDFEAMPLPPDDPPPPPPPEEDKPHDFVEAFFKSVAMIVVTELGDKTFFIAAVRLCLSCLGAN